MGMHFDNPTTQHTAASWIKDQNGTFTLGPDGTSPLDLASAYSTVAAQGTQCNPTPVVKILDKTGQPLKDDKGQVVDTGDHCKANAIAPGVANTLANMMLGVVSPSGTGRKAIIPGHSVAGKTGTTNENKTAAFGGITPDYSLGIIYFDPKGKLDVGGVGGGVPAQIYHDAMAPILASQPNHPFPAADPAVVAGTRGSGYVAPAPTPTPTPTPTAPADNQPPADTGGAIQGGGTGNGTGGGRRAPGGGGNGGGNGGGGNGGPITIPGG
jgi:membrane peptidoglycan carboxypeptidase